MASSSSVLPEDQLQCPICLDVFSDPVTTSCGHNFCMICLQEFWDSSSRYQCPVCKTNFISRPELCVNTFISGLVAPYKSSVQVKSSSRAEKPTKSQVLCEFCSEKKCAAVKSCLICMTSYCKIHLEPHERVSSFIKHKLIDPVEKLEDYICQTHERPLELFCRDDQTCVCQFCTLDDHKDHSTVPIEEESGEKKADLGKTQAEVHQMIQDRVKKIEEIKHSVELYQVNTEQKKADSVKVFRSLILNIERNQAELLKVMEEKQKATERQAEEFIKELEQEITELKRRNTELEQISHTEDHLHLLQIYPSLCSPPPTKNWTEIRINPHLSVEPLRRALSQLQQSLDEEMKKIVETEQNRTKQTHVSVETLRITLFKMQQALYKLNKIPEIELKRIQQYAVDVNLDPDTAHPKLILSDDGKEVTHGDTKQNLPDNPERFNEHVYVLGKEGFSTGRFYYEVQVKGKTDWDLGVTRESSNRKGKITPHPNKGFWCVGLRKDLGFFAYEINLVLHPLKQALQIVGVFVDYEEGLVSFYDVENQSHIYSFIGQSFTEKLYPIFSPSMNKEDKNSAPLIICPVSEDSY